MEGGGKPGRPKDLVEPDWPPDEPISNRGGWFGRRFKRTEGKTDVTRISLRQLKRGEPEYLGFDPAYGHRWSDGGLKYGRMSYNQVRKVKALAREYKRSITIVGGWAETELGTVNRLKAWEEYGDEAEAFEYGIPFWRDTGAAKSGLENVPGKKPDFDYWTQKDKRALPNELVDELSSLFGVEPEDIDNYNTKESGQRETVAPPGGITFHPGKKRGGEWVGEVAVTRRLAPWQKYLQVGGRRKRWDQVTSKDIDTVLTQRLLGVLESTETGSGIVNAAGQQGPPQVVFGGTGRMGDRMGKYDPESHTIFLHESYRYLPPEFGAAVLAHELEHSTQRWARQSIEDELASHVAHAKVWEELRSRVFWKEIPRDERLYKFVQVHENIRQAYREDRLQEYLQDLYPELSAD